MSPWNTPLFVPGFLLASPGIGAFAGAAAHACQVNCASLALTAGADVTAGRAEVATIALDNRGHTTLLTNFA